MNYNLIEDIFKQTTDNLTCWVNNTAYDDNSYGITSGIPSWLKFNGVNPTAIYANGNSWIGLTSTTENIKFNRRDAKMWYLWSEEGTLFSYYHFFRIRWRGYSQYNNTSNSCLQEWEVLFFDTGDICIHAINIPTSNYSGTNNIVASTVYAYTALTIDSPYVTFYSQDVDNKTFTVEQSIIDLKTPYDRKYLVRSESTIYTIIDGALNELTASEVTADLFRSSGVDDLPSGDLLVGLVNPEVLYWMDSTEYEVDKFKAIETATPPVQTLYSADYDMIDATIKGIESVNAVADSGILFGVSFDSGTSWQMWNGTEWTVLSESDTGMTADVLNGITSEQWNAVAVSGKIKFRIVIPNANNKFTSLVVDYLN